MKRPHHLLSGLAAFFVMASLTTPGFADDQPPGPEGLLGFSGQVRGVVVKKREKNVIEFKVGRLIRTWESNKASQPELLVGRTVPVSPRWVQDDDGKWTPSEVHVKFLRTLKPGEELTLELKHAEREHFAILELSGEQRERAAQANRGERKEKEGHNAEIAELRREIERLREENQKLRQDRERDK